ncbi:MAG: CvpA family protein [Bacteroidota bacterium]|nr:CvpA family protein [Bacteroidota bacterium]
MITYIDIIVFITVLLFILLGYKDGFFRKVFSILSLFIGFIIATKLMGPFGKLIIEWFEFAPYFSYPFAFFAILITVMLIVMLIYRWLGSKGTVLKLINRFGGALLGAAQGLLLMSLALLVLKFVDVPSEETKRDSFMYIHIINVAPKVFDFALTAVPESKTFFEEIEKNLEKYKDEL